MSPPCRDYTIAARACHSCARVLYPFSTERQSHSELTLEIIESLGDDPLLSKFNLQSYFSHVWDHEDLSRILVCLVEACDKRDFKPVIECLLGCNKRRRKMLPFSASDSVDGSRHLDQQNTEFDVYRTTLYLAKYQCTTAFHAFFPATVKPCKGYHFWVSGNPRANEYLPTRLTCHMQCPVVPVPIFDRLFRDGAERMENRQNLIGVSDVALAFRSVFGESFCLCFI